MVGQRTLDPPVEVRILPPQPQRPLDYDFSSSRSAFLTAGRNRALFLASNA